MTLKELIRGKEDLFYRFVKMAKDFYEFKCDKELNGAIMTFIEMFRGNTELNYDEVDALAEEIMEEIKK